MADDETASVCGLRNRLITRYKFNENSVSTMSRNELESLLEGMDSDEEEVVVEHKNPATIEEGNEAEEDQQQYWEEEEEPAYEPPRVMVPAYKPRPNENEDAETVIDVNDVVDHSEGSQYNRFRELVLMHNQLRVDIEHNEKLIREMGQLVETDDLMMLKNVVKGLHHKKQVVLNEMRRIESVLVQRSKARQEVYNVLKSRFVGMSKRDIAFLDTKLSRIRTFLENLGQ